MFSAFGQLDDGRRRVLEREKDRPEIYCRKEGIGGEFAFESSMQCIFLKKLRYDAASACPLSLSRAIIAFTV